MTRSRSGLILFVYMTLFSSCHVARFFVWNFADIKDNRKFPKLEIKKGDKPYIFSEITTKNSVKLPKELKAGKKKCDMDGFLKKTKTVAFIIIRNDTILYQKYLGKYDQSSIVPSFSMAKSFTSLLLGIAIDEGAIKSVHEPITNYLPELTNPGFDKVTIENLLDMRSGIRFNEGYVNPFGDVAKYYYGLDLKKYITKLKIQNEPDEKFKYSSVNAQLLGMIVERAVHKSLAEYMEDKVWKYLGAEYDASWSIDSKKDKEVKAFCCFNATPKDYAKLGELYLNKGNWNGKQIVSSKWVDESLNLKGKKNTFYSYQWWHTLDDFGNNRIVPANDFYALGLLGEYIYVYPQKNIVIVRLGKKEGARGWATIMKTIARAN